MRMLLMLIIVTSVGAFAQTPQELLRLAQETYKSPDGYEIKGRVSIQPPNSSWQVSVHLAIAAAPAPFDSPQAVVNPAMRVGGPIEYTKVSTGNDNKPEGFGFPAAVTLGWTQIAENVESVREVGTEQLPLNGAPVDCRVLEVEYNTEPDEAKPAPVRYWICSDTHLVLKKVMFYPTGRHASDPLAQWTIVFDTVEFHRPAPSWLRDLKNQPTLVTRKEWLGKPAPGFKLADLDGNSVELSSLRGKVVLLDFWSTACPPCVRELPSIQKEAEAHKDDLIFWGVSFDQPARDRKWLAQRQQSFPTLFDPDFVVSDLYKVHGIPAVVVISRKGKILNYWQGEVPTADLDAAITKHLERISKRSRRLRVARVVVDGRKASGLHSVNVQGSIEVIDLVLQDAGVPAGSLDDFRLALVIQAVNADLARARNKGDVACEAEASLEERLCGFRQELNDRIRDHVKGDLCTGTLLQFGLR